MSSLRKLRRSIATAQATKIAAKTGMKVGEARKWALVPTSKTKTAKLRRYQDDQAKIRAANEAAVAADPELTQLTDEQLAERNLAAADAKG